MKNKKWHLKIIIILMILGLTGCVTHMKSNNIHNNQASEDNVKLGLLYLEGHNFSLAQEKLTLAVSEAPHSPTALDAMAYFWEKKGNTVLAEKYYQTALRYNPNNGAVLNNYAVFLCQQKDIHTAQKLFSKAAHLENYALAGNAVNNAKICEEREKI